MDEPNDRKLEKCKVLNNTQIENFVLNKTFTRHSKTFKTRSNLDDFKLSIQDAICTGCFCWYIFGLKMNKTSLKVIFQVSLPLENRRILDQKYTDIKTIRTNLKVRDAFFQDELKWYWLVLKNLN